MLRRTQRGVTAVVTGLALAPVVVAVYVGPMWTGPLLAAVVAAVLCGWPATRRSSLWPQPRGGRARGRGSCARGGTRPPARKGRTELPLNPSAGGPASYPVVRRRYRDVRRP
ncbi:hypothetical protein ACFWUW_24770 [Streptomyces sp. NPDC058655]|uniref:hypothetical protein n=1 Tax=unclassified Streptomyces TaxID=2593676 RepID=UPI003653E468